MVYIANHAYAVYIYGLSLPHLPWENKDQADSEQAVAHSAERQSEVGRLDPEVYVVFHQDEDKEEFGKPCGFVAIQAIFIFRFCKRGGCFSVKLLYK